VILTCLSPTLEPRALARQIPPRQQCQHREPRSRIMARIRWCMSQAAVYPASLSTPYLPARLRAGSSFLLVALLSSPIRRRHHGHGCPQLIRHPEWPASCAGGQPQLAGTGTRTPAMLAVACQNLLQLTLVDDRSDPVTRVTAAAAGCRSRQFGEGSWLAAHVAIIRSWPVQFARLIPRQPPAHFAGPPRTGSPPLSPAPRLAPPAPPDTAAQPHSSPSCQGSVKDQPKQPSRTSRNTVRHQPKARCQASAEVTQSYSGAGGAPTHDRRIMSPASQQP
jgi:hypothetical protein